MYTPLKISFLDDHPAVTESYKNCIAELSRFKDLSLQCFNNIGLFYCQLVNQNIPDILFLDLNMPPYESENIEDGYHLAKTLRDKFPLIKIIILTMHTSPLYIYDVIEKIRPEAFLLKSDVDIAEIKNALNHVVALKQYYSQTTKKAINTIKEHSFCEEETNRNILLLTFKRFTNKEISENLKISESTIEKRKSIIKQSLGLERQNDRSMIGYLINLAII